MRNLKRFNEATLSDVKDTSILDDIEHVFATLIEDYSPGVTEFMTGVTVLTFKKLDCVVCSTIEEYHLSIQKQAHLVDSIIECIHKLRINVPGLVTRIDNGYKAHHIESKISIRVFLASQECADVISRMI
jgi:hypothetical protein